MNRTTRIRMKQRRDVTDLAGEKVMVDFEQGKYFCIKGVGNDIWDMLEEQPDADGNPAALMIETILHKLLEEYEVTEEVCEKEMLEFLDKLKQAGILEEV